MNRKTAILKVHVDGDKPDIIKVEVTDTVAQHRITLEGKVELMMVRGVWSEDKKTYYPPHAIERIEVQ